MVNYHETYTDNDARQCSKITARKEVILFHSRSGLTKEFGITNILFSKTYKIYAIFKCPLFEV